jgi:polar amino acid transport system substrate-binding protein
MSIIRRTALVSTTFATLLALPAFAQEDRLKELQDQGFARIAIANEPPFTAVAGDGKVSGAGPDVARAVFKALGIESVEATVTEYGAMIPGVQARRVDAITAGLYMKPERCEAVAYSEPVLCDGEGFLMKKELTETVKTFADLASAGLQIGTFSAGSEEKYALAAGVAQDKITYIPDGPSGVKMLQDGRIDVLVTTALSINSLAMQAADDTLGTVLPVADAPVSCDGAAFNAEDVALRDAFDVELKKLKDSGEFKAIIEPYGFSADVALSTSRAVLCEGHGPN